MKRNVLFTGVSPRRVTALIPRLTVESYRRGETIFNERTRGRDLYLLLTGIVRIRKHTRFGEESLLALLHEGDFFGELSILDGLPRSARAEAAQACWIARFPASEFRELILNERAFTHNLLQNLALRLRTMDRTFVQELDRHALAARKQVSRLHLLMEATKTVNSTIDLDRLLTVILNAATRSINADRGTMYLVDPATGELSSRVVQGENIKEIRLSPGKGLAGYVAGTGETVNIPNAYSDPRFNPEIDRKSGYKTRNVLCMPMRNREGTIVGVFQFLNKRRGAFTREDEEFIAGFSIHASIALENARMAREMVESERLSAVGRMAGTIIHDIKNPLATLRMYAQVIKSRTDDEEALQLADQMMRQIDRFVHMAQDVLDFSRGMSRPAYGDALITDLLNDAAASLKKEIEKKDVRLVRSFEFAGAVPVDADKMVRVFHNLLGNALEAMTGPGEITLATRPADGMVDVEIADTGIGMSEEVRARAFESFFTHGKKHGTGLGLAIVKRIVEDHGGSVRLESAPGKGTAVRIRLPLTPPA
ncbi:MAG: ATP-binding protein [Bacteroidota bacterium]